MSHNFYRKITGFSKNLSPLYGYLLHVQ